MSLFTEADRLIRRGGRQVRRFAVEAGSGAKERLEEFLEVAGSAASDAEQFATRSPGDTVLEFTRPLQADGYSCAVMSTVAVLRYYGFDIDRARLKRKLNLDEDGTAYADVVRHLRSKGLTCAVSHQARKATLTRAIHDGAPVLVSVDGDHAAVVFGVGAKAVYLADPSVRRARRVVHTWKEFLRRWDRVAITVRGNARRPGAGWRE